MAKDDETGIDPVAENGEVDDVTAARRKREAQEKREGTKGSVAERAEKGQLEDSGEPAEGAGEEDDGQLFVWEQGRKVTLGNLVDRKVPVEHVFVFGGRRSKGRGGLMALDEQPIMVVRGMAGRVAVVPTHDDDGKVTKVTIENHVEARVVMPADSDEAVALVGPIVDARRTPAAAGQ